MNTPATHTPGPWTACRTIFNGATETFHIAGKLHGSSMPLCECGDWKGSAGELEANAYLIAAAPDLLAALEALTYVIDNLHAFEPDIQLPRCLAQARQAIAKATKA